MNVLHLLPVLLHNALADKIMLGVGVAIIFLGAFWPRRRKNYEKIMRDEIRRRLR